jgi:cyclase
MAVSLIESDAADRVVVWTAGGDTLQTSYGANCIGILGRESVVVVDPLITPALAGQVDAALRRRTQVPVRFVVFTHHHTDHTWGASVFASQGAAVVAHQACWDRMAEEHPALLASRRASVDLAPLFADVTLVLPTVTYDATVTLHLGDVDVEVWHPGWGHTPGDTFLFVPEWRVAICGDLVFEGYHFNYEQASIPGVRQGLKALQALDADVFVPGHGSTGGPEILEHQAAYHEAIQTLITTGVAQGTSDETLVQQVRQRFPDYRLATVIPTSVAQLKRHLPTAPKQ